MDLATKTKIFSFAFCGLSSKLEIVSSLSMLAIAQQLSLYKVASLDELLDLDGAYFFHNFFAKMRYFSSGMSTK